MGECPQNLLKKLKSWTGMERWMIRNIMLVNQKLQQNYPTINKNKKSAKAHMYCEYIFVQYSNEKVNVKCFSCHCTL